MIGDPDTGWLSRRNRFNHDWLKNQYLMALGKLLNVLDDRIEDDGFVEQFLNGELQTWEHEFHEAQQLIDHFASSMSPQVLFDRVPFSHATGTLPWLPSLTDVLWREKHQIDVLTTTARDALLAANQDYLLIIANLNQSDNQPLDYKELYPLLVKFTENCRRLAEAVGTFPNRILVY